MVEKIKKQNRSGKKFLLLNNLKLPENMAQKELLRENITTLKVRAFISVFVVEMSYLSLILNTILVQDGLVFGNQLERIVLLTKMILVFS